MYNLWPWNKVITEYYFTLKEHEVLLIFFFENQLVNGKSHIDRIL